MWPFNLLKKSKSSTTEAENIDTFNNGEKRKIEENLFIDKGDPNQEKRIPLFIETGYPIDKVNIFMLQDLTEKGYADAEKNSSFDFLKQNLDILFGQLGLILKQTELVYDNLIFECESKIEMFEKQLLVDAIERLTKKIEIYKKHKELLSQINKTYLVEGKETSATQTYKCGFHTYVTRSIPNP